MECTVNLLAILENINFMYLACTAIPYRVSTGPEQDFPCVVNSHREKPVFISGNPFSHCRGPCIHYRDFPLRITTQGDPCSHYREWVCSVIISVS